LSGEAAQAAAANRSLKPGDDEETDAIQASPSSLPGLTRQSMLTEGMKSFWVYILASRPRGTLYVGITNDLIRRVYEHREALVEGFTKGYGVKMLVYCEQHARQ